MTADTYERTGQPDEVEARMRKNVVWGQFPHLSSWRDMRVASRTGKLPGKFEPKDGSPWASTVWEARWWKRHYGQYLPAKYEGVWGLPLRSGKIRLALDVGGGSGRFAAALRSLYNITCMTTVRLTRPVCITKCVPWAASFNADARCLALLADARQRARHVRPPL